jgi:NAD(P)-dependent dehydrogenase (short-subunit alcohol dehydrogenase family)
MDILLVVGGSGGVGRAVTAALLDQDAQVVSASIEESNGGDAVHLSVDITNEVSVNALFSRVAELGTLRGVVNAAGVVFFKELHETTLVEWQRVITVNLTGTFLCCREAIKLFQKSGGGRIVNVTSLSNQGPLSRNGAYAASKAGVKMMTAIINEEYGSQRIRATAVHLGAVDTAAWDSYPEYDRAGMLETATVGRVIASIVREPLEVRVDEITIAPGGGVL